MSPWLPASDTGVGDAEQTEDRPSREHVFPRDVLDLSVLQRANGHVRLSIGELRVRRARLQNLELGVALDDGHLKIDPLTGQGSIGGRFDVRFDLQPVAAGHRAHARVSLNDGSGALHNEWLQDNPARSRGSQSDGNQFQNRGEWWIYDAG